MFKILYYVSNMICYIFVTWPYYVACVILIILEITILKTTINKNVSFVLLFQVCVEFKPNQMIMKNLEITFGFIYNVNGKSRALQIQYISALLYSTFWQTKHLGMPKLTVVRVPKITFVQFHFILKNMYIFNTVRTHCLRSSPAVSLSDRKALLYYWVLWQAHHLLVTHTQMQTHKKYTCAHTITAINSCRTKSNRRQIIMRFFEPFSFHPPSPALSFIVHPVHLHLWCSCTKDHCFCRWTLLKWDKKNRS